MNLANVFNDFCTELSNRKCFFSEDNIRFYWFASMLKQDNNLNHYSLEEPYPTLNKKELDLMYYNSYNNCSDCSDCDVYNDCNDCSEIWAIEIKFHRHTSDKTFPHPNSAGAIFDDIQRLPSWTNYSGKPVRYFFLYVTDIEMHKYLSSAPALNHNYRENLRVFYSSPIGKVNSLSFGVSDTPKSFYEKACESCSANVSSTGVLSFSGINIIAKRDDLQCKACSSLQTGECWVRLYEILQSNNNSAQEIVE